MSTVAYTTSSAATWTDARAQATAATHTSAKLAALALAGVLAMAFRVSALSTYSLSEDELNKVHAIEQYRAGHFSANAEHPMLMKLAMWGSVDLADEWNRFAPVESRIPLETAIRLPNAIAGAATTAVLFGVADLLFGGAVAGAVAFIWAFDVNAIAINRIGKEDSLLLLFFLLAVFCYERAKKIGAGNADRAQRWYALSGASFGLMLASKYMPHFIGIYAIFNLLADHEPGRNKPDRLRHYGAMAAAFLAANAAILLPETWRYAASYVQGGMLAHHGFLYAGRLYVTNIPVSPLGVPPTYYLRLLAMKVPLVVLAALVPGVIELARRRHERGFTLLRVLAVFVIVPYSLMAAKFLRYSLPMLAIVDLLAAVGLVAGVSWLLRKSWLSPLTRVTVSAAALGVFVASVVAAQETAAPFYSLFQNAIGARIEAPASTFPEETYDFGIREAVSSIAAAAAPNAVIVSDATGAVAHYVREAGRWDIAVLALSSAGIPSDGRDTWVVVQDEHTTFENELLIRQLRASQRPWQQIYAAGVIAAQVFRMTRT